MPSKPKPKPNRGAPVKPKSKQRRHRLSIALTEATKRALDADPRGPSRAAREIVEAAMAKPVKKGGQSA